MWVVCCRYAELNKALRAGSKVVLDEALRDGAAGEIVTEARNRRHAGADAARATQRAAVSDPDPFARLRRCGVEAAAAAAFEGGAALESPRSFRRAARLFCTECAAAASACRELSMRAIVTP